MKLKASLILLMFVLALSVSGSAQETTSAAESVEKLKAQLLELQEKEEGLRTRLAQLDESIKPENIERSLAGVGSTRPEELREARRRQLSIERDGVVAQLQTLETGQLRLESALANAEALAYQQSARPDQMTAAFGSRYQLFMLAGGGLAALALGSGGAFLYRKRRVR